MSEERQQRIEEKVDILVSGQIDLGMRVTKVEERLEKVDEGQEELCASVRQIAEWHAAHTLQIERGCQGLHAALDQRLRPLEGTVRDHSAILKRSNPV